MGECRPPRFLVFQPDAVTAIVDVQFAHFGIPEKLFSDNGPQFSSGEFKEFTKRLGIEHITSSPNYPRSSGQVEREIQTVKKSMMIMVGDGRSLGDILRAIRNTPIGGGRLFCCREDN